MTIILAYTQFLIFGQILTRKYLRRFITPIMFFLIYVITVLIAPLMLMLRRKIFLITNHIKFKVMKTIDDFFAIINKAESDLSMAVLDARFSLTGDDKKTQCAHEILEMMLSKLNETSDKRKDICNKYLI